MNPDLFSIFSLPLVYEARNIPVSWTKDASWARVCRTVGQSYPCAWLIIAIIRPVQMCKILTIGHIAISNNNHLIDGPDGVVLSWRRVAADVTVALEALLLSFYVMTYEIRRQWRYWKQTYVPPRLIGHSRPNFWVSTPTSLYLRGTAPRKLSFQLGFYSLILIFLFWYKLLRSHIHFASQSSKHALTSYTEMDF